ncbi:MAG: hypothetical protein AAE983_03720 [Thermoplasmataceae archaeon]|jgi:hypothetical protein
MTPLIKSLIIILVASAVVVPSGIYAYNSIQGHNGNMLSYVPGNSSAVVSYTNNSTTYYAFSANKSLALIAPVSLDTLVNEYSSNTTSSISNAFHNLNLSVNMSIYTTFHGFTVVRIGENISLNLSKIMEKFSGSYKLPDYMNSTGRISKTVNTSIFATQINSGNVEIGGLGAIYSSITSYKSGTSFASEHGKAFMKNANVSIFVNLSNRYFDTLNINAFSNHTFMNMTFSNSSSKANVSSLLGIIQKEDNNLIISSAQGQNYISLEISAGIANISRLSDLNTGFFSAQ